nr:unnamed protein product [Callosobruchus chinensis]CAH7756845.1 unnamed protein product [Callosobruchus chinensis]
MFILHIQNHP